MVVVVVVVWGGRTWTSGAALDWAGIVTAQATTRMSRDKNTVLRSRQPGRWPLCNSAITCSNKPSRGGKENKKTKRKAKRSAHDTADETMN